MMQEAAMALTLRGATWWIEIRVSKDIDPTGRIRRSTKTTDKKLAEQLHKQLETQIFDGTFRPEKSAMTLRQAFEEALAVHYREHKSISTVQTNYKIVEKLLGANTLLSAIDTLALNRMVKQLQAQGLAAGTINRKLSAVSRLLSLAVEWDILAKVPKIPLQAETEGRIRYLSKAEEVELLKLLRQDWDFSVNKSRPWDATRYLLIAQLFEVLLDTGGRLSEVLNLLQADVDLEHRTVHFWETKADLNRSVPMTNRVHAILSALKDKPAPFKELSKSQVDHVFSIIRERMGLAHDKEFVVHALRHTCATRLVKGGWDVRKVQVWMGHKDIHTTLRYTHVDPEDLRGGASVLEPSMNVMQGCIEGVSSTVVAA
jgi:integrase